MIVNIPCFFGCVSDDVTPHFVPMSSEWIALDGVDTSIPFYEKYEGDLVFVKKTKDNPDELDLVVVPNTKEPKGYPLMTALYCHANKEDIIGFVCGFYHPYGSGVVKHPIVGRM